MKDEKEMTAQELEQVNGGVHSPKLFSPLLNKESVDPDIDRIWQEAMRHTQGQSISLGHNDSACDLQFLR